MKNLAAGKYSTCFLFICLLLIVLDGLSQQMIPPVRGTLLLSGNFGELRATHFHSGIDIRTGGVEGLPVLCVKAGRLARVSVSPVGYGNALYIEHADGTTTVYGHLQRFVPPVAEMVRELQYQHERFRLDQDFRSRDIYFGQGDTIAYSGNSGSSGGPHLHFEIRDTYTEHPLNPLCFYAIRDTKAPQARKLYLYAIDAQERIHRLRQIPLKPEKDGSYRPGRIAVPAGRIGVGVYVTDFMDGSWNKLGIYRLALVAGRDTLFRLHMDSCAFDQNSCIHAVKDFECYGRKETVYRCFGNCQRDCFGIWSRHKGYVEVPRDSSVQVVLTLADINGNRSRVSFVLQGTEKLPETGKNEPVLHYARSHVLELPGCRVELPACALFSSIPEHLRIERDSSAEREIFVLAEEKTPLFKKARLMLDGVFEARSLICELDDSGRRHPVETVRTANGLEAQIGWLGRYTVCEDRQAPELVYWGKFPDRTLRFRTGDDFSGLARWRGEVNGKWCLFAYDPRVNVLQCSLDEPLFLPGQLNEVRVCVEDQAGNKRELLVKVKV